MELGSLEYDRRWHCTATATSLTRHRAATPAERTRQASCRYAYEPDPTSLAPICPANLTSPRADTPTTPTTCHADMPVTRTRLGRALLPRYTRLGRASLPRPPNPSLASYCYPTRRQDLAPLRLRFDPVAGTVLPPHELISSVPIRLRIPRPVACIVLLPEPIRPRADMPTEPALAPYCYR